MKRYLAIVAVPVTVCVILGTISFGSAIFAGALGPIAGWPVVGAVCVIIGILVAAFGCLIIERLFLVIESTSPGPNRLIHEHGTARIRDNA